MNQANRVCIKSGIVVAIACYWHGNSQIRTFVFTVVLHSTVKVV